MSSSAVYRLKVVGEGGVEKIVEFGSSSSAEAVRRATQLGWVVLAIEPSVSPVTTARLRPGRFSLLLFSHELLALLEAGLHLNEALSALLDKERRPAAAGVLQTLTAELATGRNFSDVLADIPQHFPPVYVAVVRAAERTGDLPRALSRFIAYQLQFDQIRKKLIAACIYPAVLLVVGSAVTLFLVAYVVPRFSQVYASAGRSVPPMSAALLSLGHFIQQNGMLLAAVLLAGVAAMAVWLGQRGGLRSLADIVLRLPGIAYRAQQFRLARFYRAIGLLLAAGIALPRALGMVQGLLGAAQQTRLAEVRSLVEQGQPLSQALIARDLASPVARSLLTVGERSGQLGDMLERSARFHDEDLERWLDWAARLLEPVLMTLIGVIVGGVVLLMYLPIFELAGGL